MLSFLCKKEKTLQTKKILFDIIDYSREYQKYVGGKYMKNMKKCLIGMLLGLVLLTGCSKNENQLVLVTEAGFAPYEYYQGGEIVGVDIDIAKEIANYMGKKLVVKDVAFDSIINELNSGKADFAAAGMSITPERLEEVDFSIQYVTSNQVVMVREDSNITMDKIDGKKIAVQLGNVADSYAGKNYKNSKIVRQKKYLTMVEDLKAGKVDLIIMDNFFMSTQKYFTPSFIYFLKNNCEIVV